MNADKYQANNNKWIGSPPAVSEEKDRMIQCVCLVMRAAVFQNILKLYFFISFFIFNIKIIRKTLKKLLIQYFSNRKNKPRH